MYRHQVYSLWLIIACLFLVIGVNTDSKAGPSKYRKYIKTLSVFQANNLEAVREGFEKKSNKMISYVSCMSLHTCLCLVQF